MNPLSFQQDSSQTRVSRRFSIASHHRPETGYSRTSYDMGEFLSSVDPYDVRSNRTRSGRSATIPRDFAPVTVPSSRKLRGSFSGLTDFRSIFRRASSTVKQAFASAPLKERSGGDTHDWAGVQTGGDSRSRGWLRKVKSKGSRQALREAFQEHGSSTMHPYISYPVPGHGRLPPHFPRDPFSGSAARAAAAAQNQNHNQNQNQIRNLNQSENENFRLPILQKSVTEALSRHDSKAASLQHSRDDSESGIVMIEDEHTVELSSSENVQGLPSIRMDPFAYLPSELTQAILTSVDAQSVVNGSLVSQQWRKHCTSSYVWRSIFLREYFHATPPHSSYPIGSAGTGPSPSLPGQDWQAMYKARTQLDRVWKSGNPTPVYLCGHTDSVYCVQFDADKIVTGSRDRTIRVWDLHTYKLLAIYGPPVHQLPSSHPHPITGRPIDAHSTERLHKAPNALPQIPAVQADERAVRTGFYHVPENSVEGPMYHDASILCLQFSADTLITGSSDSSALIWDISGGPHAYKPIHRLLGHSQGVLDLVFNDRFIVTCSKDCTISIWDRHTYTPLERINLHRGPVNAVQLRGDRLVSASGDGEAVLWDLSPLHQSSPVKLLKRFHSLDRGLACVDFSADGQYVLAGGNDHVIYRFSTSTTPSHFLSLRNNPLTRYTDDGVLISEAAVGAFRGHKELVRAVCLDAANSRLVSGSYDMGIRVYDYTAEGHQMPCRDVRVSEWSDGERDGAVAVEGRGFQGWTTSWLLGAKCDYRRIIVTSQDGRVLVMDYGYNVLDVELLDEKAPVAATRGRGLSRGRKMGEKRMDSVMDDEEEEVMRLGSSFGKMRIGKANSVAAANHL